VGVLPDITPLRVSAPFRRYYAGQVFSLLGSQFSVVALRYQTYQLSGSTLTVGLLALVQLFPLLIAAIGFGQIADAFDRRKVLLVTQLTLASCSVLLMLNAASDSPKLWLVFVLGAMSSFVVGIDWPTRSAFVPGLVGEALLPKAIAISAVLYNLAGVMGPALGGLVVNSSIAWAFGLDALSYVLLFVMILTAPAQPASGTVKFGFAAIGDGLSYVKSNRLLQSTFVADIGAMVFGVPDALFPAMADKVFGGGARTFGYLQAAPGAGALIAALTSGWTGRVRRQGRWVVWMIVGWGIGITMFGLTRSLPIALLGLAIAGGTDAISAIFRSTITQVTTPNEYRGRLNALFVAVVRGGPRVGEFESGVVSSVGGLQFAAWTGGLACIGWIAVTAKLYPELMAYDAETWDSKASA
jgi:MFS family permease